MESKDKQIISDFEDIQANMLFGFKLLSGTQKIHVMMKVDLIRLLEAKECKDIEVYNILAKKYGIAVDSVRKTKERLNKSNPL